MCFNQPVRQLCSFYSDNRLYCLGGPIRDAETTIASGELKWGLPLSLLF